MLYLVDGSVPKPVTSLAPDIVLRSDLAPFVTRRIRLASIKCLPVGYLQPDIAPFLPHRRKTGGTSSKANSNQLSRGVLSQKEITNIS